jgi:hypothetical protein
MNKQPDGLDAEEQKVLKEALADSEVGAIPSAEYVAELRRRLLSVAVPERVLRRKPSRRVLLGSIVGAAVAALLVVAVWLLNAEPAWASAIRMARDQAWIHARIEQDGVDNGDLWVSPQRDVVAARLGTLSLFDDYKHQTFLRYEAKEGVVYRAFQPQNAHLGRDLSSVSSLAAVFRRSPAAPSLLPDQAIERWSVQSALVDGIPCDEYEIVVRPPDRAPTTLLLTVDRRQSLPRSLTVSEGESHTMTCRFDYPTADPLDERTLGIPERAPRVDVDKSGGELAVVARSLREGREKFDDYTTLCVTSRSHDALPLASCEARRVLRRDNKWRVDEVQTSDRRLIVPFDHDSGLKAWKINRDRFHFIPLVICDGRDIRMYQWGSKRATDGRPLKIFPVKDESTKDSFSPKFLFPERSCRPMFYVGLFNRVYDVAHEKGNLHQDLFKVDVLPTPKNPNDIPSTHWLDPSLGNVAVRIVYHPTASIVAGPNKLQSSTREITLEDFRQSPRGLWYPCVIAQDRSLKSTQITHLYVDFADIPSDDLFGPLNPTP